jgi:hypothetical protein
VFVGARGSSFMRRPRSDRKKVSSNVAQEIGDCHCNQGLRLVVAIKKLVAQPQPALWRIAAT